MPLERVLWSTALSALLTGIGLLAVGLRRRAGSAPARQASGVALAVGLGYSVGHVVLTGWAAWPGEPWQWLPHIAAAATLLTVLMACAQPPAWIGLGLDWVLALATALLMVRPMPMGTWSVGQSVAWLAGLVGAVAVSEASLAAQARRVGASTAALIMTISAAAASVVLVSSANARLGMLAGLLAASTAAVTVAGWCMPRLSFQGVTRCVTLILSGLLITAYFNDYTGLPATSFILAAASPLPAWLSLAGPVRRLADWQRAAIAMAGVAMAAVMAATLAWRSYCALGG